MHQMTVRLCVWNQEAKANSCSWCRLHIVGVTDQLVHQHVARERYLQAVMQLETEVRMHRFTSVACEMQPVCQPQSF